MLTPGAETDSPVPLLLQLATTSLLSVAATEITEEYLAGYPRVSAPGPLLPAAATRTMPALYALSHAACSAEESELEPKLMLMTCMPFAMHQSIPLTMPLIEPDPVLPKTLTAYKEASGAPPTTPMLLSKAAIIPAQCVPWPWSSSY